MQVKFGKQRREGVGVCDFGDVAIVPTYAQAIIACLQMPIIGWEQRFEDSSGLHELSRKGAALDDHAYRGGVRLNRANDHAAAFHGVRAEETKRLAMFCSRKRGKLH